MKLTKKCCDCKEDRPLTEFHKSKSRSDGHTTRCKSCTKTYRRNHHIKNLEHDKAIAKVWRDNTKERKRKHYEENREEILRKAKEYQQNNPDKIKNADLMRDFGISLEEYNKMLVDQNYGCAICGKSNTAVDKRSGKPKSLAVDHDHKTGKIRGLLCEAHNRALGMFHDNIEELMAAIKYLKK